MTDLSFWHGTRVTEDPNGPILIRTAQSAVAALILVDAETDTAAFPLNTPVLIKGSQDYTAVRKLGKASKMHVDAIFDQIGTYLYVVNVPAGLNAAATLANLVGDRTERTGVHALRKCEGMFGRKLKPRLVAVPGRTGTLAPDGIVAAQVTAPGRDYSPSTPPAVTITGDGHGATAKAVISSEGELEDIVITKPGWGFTSVSIAIASSPPVVTRVAASGNHGNGAMTLAGTAYSGTVKAGDYIVECTAAAANGGTFSVTDPDDVTLASATVGVAYDGAVKFTIADGTNDFEVGDTFTVHVVISGGFGATATATIGTTTNPIVAELTGLLSDLRAVGYVDGPDTTDENAVLWRNTFQSDRIYAIDPRVLVFDTSVPGNVPQPASPRFVGVQARADREEGFHRSVSNKVINGIVGVTRAVGYGLEANYLNEAGVGTIIAGDNGGWITWGNRSASDPTRLQMFLSVRRTTDFINEAIEQAFRSFNDAPMTARNVKRLVAAGNDFMRTLKAAEAIYDGIVFLDPTGNTDTELGSGVIRLGCKFLVPPPMEDIEVAQAYEISYFSVLRNAVLSEQDLSVTAVINT